MAKFRIQAHGRLQEWVAEEKGYFTAEGLDYEFVHGELLGPNSGPTVGPAPLDVPSTLPPEEIRKGALESYEKGRSCEISSACHWAVNQASSQGHGLMWAMPTPSLLRAFTYHRSHPSAMPRTSRA